MGASRAPKIAGLVVGLALGGIGFLPLFGGPGYEHALASGLVAPSAAAIGAALDRLAAPDRPPLSVVGRGAGCGLALALIALATALLHALRAGACDLWGGVLTFALTAGIGAVLGGVWGALVGEAVRARRRPRLAAVLGALAAPLAGIALSVWRFYDSPIVFAFDPFFGYFSGTLYDTVIDAGTALWTYRAGSAATLAGVAFAASILWRDKDGALRALPWRARPDVVVRALMAAACGAGSIGVVLGAHVLGHWESSASIAKALGGRREGARCTVIFPDGTREDDAALLVQDCEEELASVEAALGARGPDRITAFFFRDAAEKKRLMGAADTYIAKPWRKEVYLQMHGYPHPVLGHELAHVVAGSFARGPFKVAGAWGGLWPNPGLIEGIAVAASPDDDELEGAQWARAMMDLDILPSMRRVFGVGFFGDSAAKSYTVAGAFVRWAIGAYGAETVRAWYGGASLEALTHATWDELDAAFRKDLARYALVSDAEAVARAKFGRPGLFGRVCPHVVDALRQRADRCREQGQYDRAVALYAEALERDAHDVASRFARASVRLRFGDGAQGRAEIEAIARDPAAPRTWRDRADDALGDADFLDGAYGAAAGRYRAIAARSVDEDARRNLEVKAIGAEDPFARDAIRALLLGAPGRGPDTLVGGVELGAWSASTGSPLAEYLIGKNLAQHGWYRLASKHLDRALAGAVPPSVGREALRQRAICACALRDQAEVVELRARLDVLDGPFAGTAGGRRASVAALLARCAHR